MPHNLKHKLLVYIENGIIIHSIKKAELPQWFISGLPCHLSPHHKTMISKTPYQRTSLAKNKALLRLSGTQPQRSKTKAVWFWSV